MSGKRFVQVLNNLRGHGMQPCLILMLGHNGQIREIKWITCTNMLLLQ